VFPVPIMSSMIIIFFPRLRDCIFTFVSEKRFFFKTITSSFRSFAIFLTHCLLSLSGPTIVKSSLKRALM